MIVAFYYYYAKCHYAECRYSECRYIECRGAILREQSILWHSRVVVVTTPSNIKLR
jgi:hypothetical protein